MEGIYLGTHDIARRRFARVARPTYRKIHENAYRADLEAYGRELTLKEADWILSSKRRLAELILERRKVRGIQEKPLPEEIASMIRALPLPLKPRPGILTPEEALMRLLVKIILKLSRDRGHRGYRRAKEKVVITLKPNLKERVDPRRLSANLARLYEGLEPEALAALKAALITPFELLIALSPEAAIGDALELGRVADFLYGEDLPTIRLWIHHKQYVIGAVPDGVADDYVYEFNSTSQTGRRLEAIREASIRQAILCAYAFRRPRIKVQIAKFPLPKDPWPLKVEDLPEPEIETISRPTKPEEALAILREFDEAFRAEGGRPSG